MTHLKRPLAKKICTRGEYFTISNGIINLNFLAVVVSEILRGSQIYTRRRCAPWMSPSGKIFVPKSNTSQYLIVLLLFNILALVLSEILGVPNLR